MTTTLLRSPYPPITSLEDWLENPPERTEWIDGALFEKNGMTLKHSKAQSRLSRQWANYTKSSRQGGEVYIAVPCRTEKQGRCPDVAYLTPELVAEYGEAKVLPRSFPLTAEIVSPTDLAEDVIAKAEEYLQSGAEEVWLVLPENRWIIVATRDSKRIFTSGETASTQKVLAGFSISVDEFLS